MSDQAVSKEAVRAAVGQVDELIGDDHVAGRVGSLERTAGADADEVGDAHELEREDIGAVRNLRRGIAVTDAMARDEGHALTAQRADYDRRAGFAEGRVQIIGSAIGQLLHVVQTRSADHADSY